MFIGGPLADPPLLAKRGKWSLVEALKCSVVTVNLFKAFRGSTVYVMMTMITMLDLKLIQFLTTKTIIKLGG